MTRSIWYQGNRMEIPCTFLYPVGWKIREGGGKGYSDAVFTGPRNQADTFSTGLAVGVTPGAKQTPTEAANDLLAKHRSSRFTIQTRGPLPTTVAGRPAVEIEITHWMPLPLHARRWQRTVIRQHDIFFQRGDQLYQVNYMSPEEHYEACLAAFRDLVASFAFPEKPAHRVAYRPMAAAAAPQYLHDKSPEYPVEETAEIEENATQSECP